MKKSLKRRVLAMVLSVMTALTMLPNMGVYAAEDTGGTVNPIVAFAEMKKTSYNVEKGTLSEAVDVLPEKVVATFADGTTKELDATWKCEEDYENTNYKYYAFDSSVSEDYKVQSGVTAPIATIVILNYKREEATEPATEEVTEEETSAEEETTTETDEETSQAVQEQETSTAAEEVTTEAETEKETAEEETKKASDCKTVVKFEDFGNNQFDGARGTLQDVLGLFPEKVPVVLADGTKTELDATWKCRDDYDNTNLAFYLFDFQAPEGYVVENNISIPYVSYEITISTFAAWAENSTGTVTIDKALGVSKSITAYLGRFNDSSDEYYKYYLGTPYEGLNLNKYNGMTDVQRAERVMVPNGTDGTGGHMNCTGFVARVLKNLGADLTKIPRNHIGWYGNASNWNDYVHSKGIKSHRYANASEAVAAGVLHKGDVVYFEPKDWSVANADCHIGFYWGDNPTYTNKFWSSTEPANKIATLEGKVKDCWVYVFPVTTSSLDLTKKVTQETWAKDLVVNNTCYSLKGAEYTVYNDSDCKHAVGKFTTDSNGNAKAITLGAGVYYIKETKKPEKGYGWGKTHTNPVAVRLENGTSKTFVDEDPPLEDPIRALINKVPTVETKWAGNMTAEFTVKFYKGYYTDAQVKTKTPTRTWVLRTNMDGYINFRDPDLEKVRGDAFYYNKSGQRTLPLGTVTIQETKAPNGFTLNEKVFRFTIKPNSSNTAAVDNIASTGIRVEEAPKRITVRKDIAYFSPNGTDPAYSTGVAFVHTDPNGKKTYYKTFAYYGETSKTWKYGYRYRTTTPKPGENWGAAGAETVWTDEPGIFQIHGPIAGTHTIEEYEVPDDQIKDTMTIKFKVDSTGSIWNETGTDSIPGRFNFRDASDFDNGCAYVVIKNKPKNYNIRIRKVDEDGKPRAGAEFKLYSDAACTNEVGKATSDPDGYLLWEDVVPNYNVVGQKYNYPRVYYIKETKAPDGCVIPLDSSGKPHVYKVYCNMIYDTDSGLVTTNFYIDGVKLTESNTNSKNDYYISTLSNKDGVLTPTINARIENPTTAPYNFNVIKKDGAGNVLPGATFTAFKDKALTQPVSGASDVTGSDGTASLTGLLHNYNANDIKHIYYIAETEAPEGYLLPKNADGSLVAHEVYTVATPNASGTMDYVIYVDGIMHRVTETDSTKEFYFGKDGNGTLSVNMNAVNVKEAEFNFYVVKKDDKGKVLPGVEFSLYKDASRTELLEEPVLTGADGVGKFQTKLAFNLGETVSNVYYYAETKALTGYNLPVDATGKAVLHKVYAKAKLGEDGNYTYEFYLDDKLHTTSETDKNGEVFFETVNESTIIMNTNIINTPESPYNFAVLKKDDEGNLLPGAEFTVYSDKECTKMVGTPAVTSKDGVAKFTGFKHNFDASNLAYKYYITETKAPDGCIMDVNEDGSRIVHEFYSIGTRNSKGQYTYTLYLDGEKYTADALDVTDEIFVSKEGDGSLTLNMPALNYKKHPFSFRIVKKDEQKKALKGVEFSLYKDAAGTSLITKEYTDANGVGVFKDSTGKVMEFEYNYGDTLDYVYYFAETMTIPGYVLPVGSDNKPVMHKFYAKAVRNSYGKYDYSFYMDDALCNLADINSSEEIYFNVNEKDVTMNMNIVNKEVEPYNFNVIKKGDDGKLLSGAEFAVYSDKELTTIAKNPSETGSDGIVRFTGFKHNFDASNITNKYYVVETKAPDNYLAAVGDDGKKIVHEFYSVATLNSDGTYTYELYVDNVKHLLSETDQTKEFFFGEDGNGVISMNMNAINYQKHPFNFKIVKKNDKGVALEGVEFSLYSDQERQNLVSKFNTKADGTGLFENLEYNYGDTLDHVYYFAETKAIDGYRLPLGEDGKPVLHTLYAKATLHSDGTFTYEFYLDGKLHHTSETDASKDVFFTDVNEKVITMNTNLVNNIGRKLPETGSSMMFPILGAGVLLMAAALFIGRKKSKTTKIENEK